MSSRKPTPNESIRIRVNDSVLRIPSGMVSTYGAIADEHRLSPRQVAQVLASNRDDIPWHRVIKSDGRVAAHDAARTQEALLASEGIAVENGRFVAFADHLFIT